MSVEFCPFRRQFLAASAALAATGRLAWGAEDDNEDCGDVYPLAMCVVCEDSLEKRFLAIDYFGREIRLCKQRCIDDFEMDSRTWIRTIDDRITQQQLEFYPLDTYVVDGTPLKGSAELNVVFRNRLFRLCDHGCQEKLKKSPAKYFKKLDSAVVAKQKKNYPLKKCIVSGKPLGEKAVDYVVANQLVRLADENQFEGFDKAPGKYLTELRNKQTARSK